MATATSAATLCRNYINGVNISKADVDEGIRLLDKSFSEVKI